MSLPLSGFEMAFQALPEPAYLLDEAGRILACSAVGARVLGMPSELLAGQPWARLALGAEEGALLESGRGFRRRLAGMQSIRGLGRGNGKDGEQGGRRGRAAHAKTHRRPEQERHRRIHAYIGEALITRDRLKCERQADDEPCQQHQGL